MEVVPHDRVTWEVDAPGFHALHSYRFAALGPERSSFGSWEVAEGPAYRALRRFWLAHFRYVCRESLAGARTLARLVGRAGKRSAQSSCSTRAALITCEISRYQPASTSSSTSWDGVHSAASRPRARPRRWRCR